MRGVGIRHGHGPTMPLSIQIFVLLYSAATGFVVAGIVASFYQWITAEPPRFAPLGPSAAALMITFLFCAIAGPFIIMRNAIERRGKLRTAIGWVAGSLVIAGMWSVCSGLLVLDFALAARASF